MWLAKRLVFPPYSRPFLHGCFIIKYVLHGKDELGQSWIDYSYIIGCIFYGPFGFPYERENVLRRYLKEIYDCGLSFDDRTKLAHGLLSGKYSFPALEVCHPFLSI